MVIASFVFITALAVAPVSETPNTAYTAYADSTYTINYPTQEQIINKYSQLGLNFNSKTAYTEKYSLNAPYATGDISDYDRQNALNALNFCRYIAGLPADVEILPEYNKYAQAASLVNAANGELNHEPVKPSGMSDDLYKIGYDGSNHSNLASGYYNLAKSIVEGYMEDSDSNNIDRVGHRRWILFPELKYTGIGQVGEYSALYCHDNKRDGKFVGDYVAWPPPNMPMEIYTSYSGNYSFSVTLGDSYDAPDLAKVKVEVTSAKLGKTWNLDRASANISEYLTVSNEYYGDPKCIIFNVGIFPDEDTVSVKITGITKGGVESPITYNVNFFSMANAHIHNYKISSIKAASCTTEGVKTYICDECGNTYNEPIPKAEHNYSKDWTTDKQPTCAAEGSKSRHCTICNAKTDVTPIEKLEHKYTESVTKPATCATEGILTKTCSVCNDVATQAIAKIEHTFTDEWITDVQPTCIAEGSKSHHCSVCGEKTDVTALPKTTDHLYSSKTTKDPTCTKAGVVTDTCNVCGDTKTSALPALGHTFGQYVVTVQPTADKEGSEQRTCTQCNTTETRAIAKLSSDTSSSTSESTSEGNSSTSSDTSSDSSSSNAENSVTSSSSGNSDSSGSSGNSTGNSNSSGSDSTVESINSSSTSNGSGSTTSDNPTVSPAEFIKDNLTVILLAFCSAAAVTIAIIIGVVSKKKKK